MQRASITAKKVADLAEKYLEPHQPPRYRILIDRKRIRRDSEGWWEVPIRPSKTDVPSYDWISRSVEASVDLDEQENIHVLFM